ncbi:YaaR family protein [Bacillaceae bacterium]
MKVDYPIGGKQLPQAVLDKMKPKPPLAPESVSFADVMSQRRDELQLERLNRLIAEIEEQGKVLAESRTLEDLRKYKKLVQAFLEDAVEYGLRLEERHGFNRRGRSRIFKLVSEVDKKLLELAAEVLQKQENGLRILELVGEIKGLLLNIYA